MHDAADDALLAAMAAGDADAAVVFVRRFQARVFGVANAVLGDRDRADDVAQEAFVRACATATASTHGADRSSPGCSPSRGTSPSITCGRSGCGPWTTSSRSSCRWRRVIPIRRRRRRSTTSGGGSSVPCVRSRTEQRRALLLAALGGRTAQEIGVIEDIPLGTAKTRIRTGLRHVRGARPAGGPMTASPCDEVRTQAADLALDIVDGEERAALLGHLSCCPACRDEVRSLGSVADRLLRVVPAEEPPRGFEDRVMARFADQPRPPLAAGAGWWSRASVRRPRSSSWPSSEPHCSVPAATPVRR